MFTAAIMLARTLSAPSVSWSRARRTRALKHCLLTPMACWAALAHAADDGTDVQQLPAVSVSSKTAQPTTAAQGYRAEDVQVGPLGKQRLQDVPASIGVVSSELIRNTQASTATDALKYVPTVYASTGASQITPYFSMRGFSASTWTYNMALDGMRSFDVYEPMEDKDRIEILNGASGFLYGVTSPAGVVNFVSKRPVAAPLAEVTLGSLDRQLYTQADLGGAFATNATYRLNLGYADDGDTGVEHQSQGRKVISGAVDYQLTPDVKLSADAAWAKRSLDYAQALFMTSAAIGIPMAADSSKNWGAPYTGADDQTTHAGVGLEAKLNQVFSLRTKFRYTDNERDYFLNRQMWQDTALDYKWRVDSQQTTHTRVAQSQVFLDAGFTTGPFAHLVTTGVSHDNFAVGNNGYRGTTYSTLYASNLYGTPSFRAWALPPVGASSAQSTAYDAMLINDRIALGPQWTLSIGATRASVNDTVIAKTAAGVQSATRYDQARTTPAASLSYKPLDALTLYGAYSEALQQGFTAGATASNAGQAFAPYVGKQVEAGAKAHVGEIDLTAARFRIEQANQYTDPATGYMTQDGREVHEGWEFTATGNVTHDLVVVGGFTVLDAAITKATAYAGNTPQGAVDRMARLYAEYTVPSLPALTLTAGAAYTGKVPWDAANTLYLSGYTVYDAGLRYRTRLWSRDTTVRATVSNLGGKDYWTTRSGILYLGEPRTLALSATIAF